MDLKTKTVNVKNFFQEKGVVFQNDMKAGRWVRLNLNIISLVKVGPSYIAVEQELEREFELYTTRQKKIYQKKVKVAKTLGTTKKKQNLKF